jgi:trehalose-phosphatase
VGGIHLEKVVEGGMRSLRHALDAWGEIEIRIRRAGQLVLFADYDGTLVPIARTPSAVRPEPRVRRLLSMLAGKGVLLGVASGRRLSDVRRQVGLRRIFYVGSHGYSWYRPGAGTDFALNSRQRSLMAAVRRALRRRLRGLWGIRLEPKDGPVAVHYRGAARPIAAVAERAIREILPEYPTLHLLSGKKVWEILPEHRISKWTAMQHILPAKARQGPRLLFYLGDDTTDERVFSEMCGISVAVGRRGSTTALYYLRSPKEVLTFLERILAATR